VTLLPGPHLLQFKVFEGGGGWNMRARFQSPGVCGPTAPAISGAGEIIVSTTPPASELPQLPGFATRSINLVEQTESQTVVDVAVSVIGAATYSLLETFSSKWTASSPVPAGATIGAGLVQWNNISASTVSYRLTRSTAYTTVQGRLSGTLTVAGNPLRTAGATQIPTAAVREMLLSPAFNIVAGSDGCTIGPVEIDGNWIGNSDFSDAEIVPSEGFTWDPEYGSAACQATGLTTITNNAAFWSVPGDIVSSSAVIARVVASDATGLFNYNDAIYAGDPNNCVNVGWFYVVNGDSSRVPVWIATGTDDAVGVRVNGHVVFTGDFCRGNPGFADKFGTTLDPGKNLIAVYTYEAGGGFNMLIRFEDATGRPQPFDVTLDPSGYDPGDHTTPPDAVAGQVPPPYSDLGFVTQFLVPANAFDQPLTSNTNSGAVPEDYITIDGEVPDASNVFLGAPANAGSTGLITTGIRGGNACGFTPLVIFDGLTDFNRTAGDPGLFTGDVYYGNIDNYSSTLFFFLDNKRDGNETVWIGFASDDAGTLFVNGNLVSEYLIGRGYGDANTTQDPGLMEVVLTPGVNLVQLSYTEGGGGSGARVGVFTDCAKTVLDTDTVEVTTVPGGAPFVTTDRALGKIDCQGNGTVTLTFRVTDGPRSVNLIENLPPGSTGSNPSKGSFNGAATQIAFTGSVVDGDTLTYSILTQPGASYCASTANGEPVVGDRIFLRNTDLCGDIADGIRINCGGPELIDAQSQVWLEDTLAAPSNYLTSTNAYTANWAVVPNLSADPLVAERGYPADAFNWERWYSAAVEYTFSSIPNGTYEVVLLFMEGCCSDSCLVDGSSACDAVDGLVDPADPVVSAGGCRVVDLYLNDQLVADQFSQNVLAACLAGTAPGLASNNIAVTVRREVTVTDGTLKVRVQDLGDGSPPENASIKGVAITKVEAGGTTFRRGDSNADAQLNITDGIFVLNYLFLGGPTPTCLEAANANDDPSLNITDGIYILNFLFLGGPSPAAPGPDACGPDPVTSPTDLTCEAYTKC
jgi:hypothetical protein